MTQNKDYFRTFCKISKAFGTTVKKDELIPLIVQSAIDTMGGKAACLFLQDSENPDVYKASHHIGLSDKYFHADPYRSKEILATLVKDGYIAIRDVATDPRIENRALKQAEGISSILVVPVRVMDRVIGVLTLYTPVVRDFTKDEIEFLAALADQGGITIENNRLMRRIVKNNYLFRDMANSINSTNLDVKKIFHILTADIAESFNMKGVLIRLLNKKTGNLELVASYGLSEEFLNKGPVSSAENVTQMLKGETLVIRDARTDPRAQYPDAIKKEGIVSMLVVPIKAGNEVIGIMRLCSENEREFTEEMIVLMEALAHQGGLAIQNASLYLAVKEDKENLEKDIWSHRMWF